MAVGAWCGPHFFGVLHVGVLQGGLPGRRLVGVSHVGIFHVGVFHVGALHVGPFHVGVLPAVGVLRAARLLGPGRKRDLRDLVLVASL